jgi:hypothetical protein
MRILKGIWFFYKKLIIPTLIVSFTIGLIGTSIEGSHSLKGVGLGYIFLAPLFHYFIYEIRNENEYYFYYNLGLSRITLWVLTIIISWFIGILFILVC